MGFILHGIHQAFVLLRHPTPDLESIVRVTLELAFWSACFALLLGVPVGLALGLGRFRGRRVALSFAHGGLGLPPVVVGLFMSLLLFRGGPLGWLDWIYTLQGMVLAQTILALPIVIAITAAAAQAIDPALLAQGRALGASRFQLGVFATREARVGIVVAAIGAVGAAVSEVGAVILVGGNIDLQTRTMAGAILTDVSAGNYAEGIAVGILLLGLVLFLAAGLTLAQQGAGERDRAPRQNRSLVIGGR